MSLESGHVALAATETLSNPPSNVSSESTSPLDLFNDESYTNDPRSSELDREAEQNILRKRTSDKRIESKSSQIVVIEILSSDEEDLNDDSVHEDDTFSINIPGAFPASPINKARVSVYKAIKTNEVIELSDSSPEPLPRTKAKPPSESHKRAPKKDILPLFVDDSDDDENSDNDSAILTFDEPRSARKPVKLPLQELIRTTLKDNVTPLGSPTKKRVGSSLTVTLQSDPTPTGTPTSTHLNIPSILPSTTPSIRKTGTQAVRRNKKAQAVADLARRKIYAEELFRELNTEVFDCKLPAETELKWNKRLLTTAGRAKWHRSSSGVHTTEIELAEKILDCEERIRNTLSHEMCHLACWVINSCPKEGHGPLFKAWAAKVMDCRPEIEITTRHNYEISYPYQWECEKCAKIYGRFSKSIRPDECVCGACRVGKLIPLFSTVKRPPKTPKMARMAAEKPQDSPKSLPRNPASPFVIDLSGSSPNKTQADRTENPKKEREISCLYGSDSEPDDEDVQILADIMRTASITQD